MKNIKEMTDKEMMTALIPNHLEVFVGTEGILRVGFFALRKGMKWNEDAHRRWHLSDENEDISVSLKQAMRNVHNKKETLI